MIQHAAFKHGWFYHYRLHIPKSQNLLLEYPELQEFLQAIFTSCPHEKFMQGPRSSKLRFSVDVELTELPGHEICDLAAASLQYGSYSTAHTNVEMGLLAADSKTISVEVPLWLDPEELEGFETLFESDQPLTGHVDILRVENGKVWIWDYKPDASREKWAATQLNTYATMLSKRTGVSLDNIMCGYFDEETSFVFKPVKL